MLMCIKCCDIKATVQTLIRLLIPELADLGLLCLVRHILAAGGNPQARVWAKNPQYPNCGLSPANTQYMATIGPPGKRHLNGASLGGRWWSAFTTHLYRLPTVVKHNKFPGHNILNQCLTTTTLVQL